MNIRDEIVANRIIAILRGIPIEQILHVVQALHDGGIKLVEITFNQASVNCIAETVRAISLVKERMNGSVLIGAGTVLSVQQVEAAAKAGASYILAPNVDERVIFRCKELEMCAIPGAFTPTEMVAACNAGADVVKLFPAHALGIPYIKAITAPLNNVPIIAVGGVDEYNVAEFIRSGVIGVGVGSNIVKGSLIQSENYAEITTLARKYVEATNTI